MLVSVRIKMQKYYKVFHFWFQVTPLFPCLSSFMFPSALAKLIHIMHQSKKNKEELKGPFLFGFTAPTALQKAFSFFIFFLLSIESALVNRNLFCCGFAALMSESLSSWSNLSLTMSEGMQPLEKQPAVRASSTLCFFVCAHARACAHECVCLEE